MLFTLVMLLVLLAPAIVGLVVLRIFKSNMKEKTYKIIKWLLIVMMILLFAMFVIMTFAMTVTSTT